jgi:hypothetical protein
MSVFFGQEFFRDQGRIILDTFTQPLASSTFQRMKRTEKTKKGELRTVVFDVWKRRFDLVLQVRTPAWNGVQRWIAYRNKYIVSAMAAAGLPQLNPDHPFAEDPRTWVLRSLYLQTSPPAEYKTRKKQDKYTRERIRRLCESTNDFLRHAQSRETVIESQDHLFGVDMRPVVESFRHARLAGITFLDLAEKRYTRDRDLLEICYGLYLYLTRFVGVRDRQARALIRLSLLAHGYDEAEADVFSTEAPNDNLRKRIDARTKAAVDFVNTFFSAKRR